MSFKWNRSLVLLTHLVLTVPFSLCMPIRSYASDAQVDNSQKNSNAENIGSDHNAGSNVSSSPIVTAISKLGSHSNLNASTSSPNLNRIRTISYGALYTGFIAQTSGVICPDIGRPINLYNLGLDCQTGNTCIDHAAYTMIRHLLPGELLSESRGDFAQNIHDSHGTTYLEPVTKLQSDSYKFVEFSLSDVPNLPIVVTKSLSNGAFIARLSLSGSPGHAVTVLGGMGLDANDNVQDLIIADSDRSMSNLHIMPNSVFCRSVTHIAKLNILDDSPLVPRIVKSELQKPKILPLSSMVTKRPAADNGNC